MPEGIPDRRCSPEFQQMAEETMREGRLRVREAMRRSGMNVRGSLERRERTCPEEGLEEGSAAEGRRRECTAQAAKLSLKKVAEDLIAENRRLRAEADSLNNLQTMALAEARRQRGKCRQFHNQGRNIPLSLPPGIARLPRAIFCGRLKRIQNGRSIRAGKRKSYIYYLPRRQRMIGCRRIVAKLHSRGGSLNHKTVRWEWFSRVRIRKYRSCKGKAGGIAPNLPNRNFYAERTKQKQVADMPESDLFCQKICPFPIPDPHNGDPVSHTISDRTVLRMAASILERAHETIPDVTDLILHADQGGNTSAGSAGERSGRRASDRARAARAISQATQSRRISPACSEINCRTCKNANPWSASGRNRPTIWITTITAESRQSERTCRLSFTGNKSFQLLEHVVSKNILNVLGALHFWRCGLLRLTQPPR